MSEHFSLWQQRCLQNAAAHARAYDVLHTYAAQKNLSEKESGDLSQKSRAWTVLFSLQQPGCQIQDVDEWNAAGHLRGFFIRLQETIVREEKFLSAYLFVDTFGGRDTQKGEGEDFREACLRFAGCAASEGKFLRELMRGYKDVAREMVQKKETVVLYAVRDIANRQGINTERFLSLLPALFLLDIVGRDLEMQRSGFEKASLLIRYAEQEYAAFPQKKEEDLLRIHRQQKEEKTAKRIACGLGHEEWFLKLHTPYGKERGRVSQLLERFIAGVEDNEDVRYVGAENAQELRMRSARLREGKNK